MLVGAGLSNTGDAAVTTAVVLVVILNHAIIYAFPTDLAYNNGCSEVAIPHVVEGTNPA